MQYIKIEHEEMGCITVGVAEAVEIVKRLVACSMEFHVHPQVEEGKVMIASPDKVGLLTVYINTPAQ